jgi:hypothetical protein
MRARVKTNGGHGAAVIARMFDMLRGTECENVGDPVMDIVVYLPEDRAYAMMERRTIIYRDDHGKQTAIIFTGVQMNLDDENLRRLCERLDAAKKSIVAYIRRLSRV